MKRQWLENRNEQAHFFENNFDISVAIIGKFEQLNEHDRRIHCNRVVRKMWWKKFVWKKLENNIYLNTN